MFSTELFRYVQCIVHASSGLLYERLYVDKQLGQSVLLPCDVVYDKTRGDTLTVDWTKERTPIKLDVTLPDGQLKFVKNDDNSLTINDITFEDEGEDEKCQIGVNRVFLLKTVAICLEKAFENFVPLGNTDDGRDFSTL